MRRFVLTVWAWGDEHLHEISDEHGDVEEQAEEILGAYYGTYDGWALALDGEAVAA